MQNLFRSTRKGMETISRNSDHQRLKIQISWIYRYNSMLHRYKLQIQKHRNIVVLHAKLLNSNGALKNVVQLGIQKNMHHQLRDSFGRP